MEYKFRGKRIDNNEWVFGCFVKDPLGRCRIYWQPFKEATSHTYHFVIPETVGQFTGLQDKNGKDIYLGDVLKCRANIITNKKEIKDYDNHGDIFDFGPDPKCEIKYYNNEVQWYEGHHHGYRLKNGSFTLPINQSILLTMKVEIIGSIHDK